MKSQRRAQSLQAGVVEPPRAVDTPYRTSQEILIYLRLKSLSNLYRLIREYDLPTCRAGS